MIELITRKYKYINNNFVTFQRNLILLEKEIYKIGKDSGIFEECLEEDSADGPTNTLYNYIKKFDFKSPDNWKGERELTSK